MKYLTPVNGLLDVFMCLCVYACVCMYMYMYVCIQMYMYVCGKGESAFVLRCVELNT